MSLCDMQMSYNDIFLIGCNLYVVSYEHIIICVIHGIALASIEVVQDKKKKMKNDVTYERLKEQTEKRGQDLYGRLLLDPRWKSKRETILLRDNYRCVNCGSGKNLHVHHRQYHFSRTLDRHRDIWDYRNNYLITLCQKCHLKGHSLYKVPTHTVK